MADNDSATQKTEEQQFILEKIYVKDLSFENPKSPQIFSTQWNPQINVQLNSQAKSVSDGVYEVVLSITVTAKQSENTAFLVEVQQAALFRAKNLNEDQLPPLLGIYCPTVIFPYARETISDVVIRGGYPQLLLAPVNFESLYAQQSKQQQDAEKSTEDKVH